MYKKTKINRSTQMHQIHKDTSFVEMNNTCLDDCKPQDNSSDFMSHILISSFPSNPHPPPILNPLPIGNCWSLVSYSPSESLRYPLSCLLEALWVCCPCMEYDPASFSDHQVMIYNFLQKKKRNNEIFINCQYIYILYGAVQEHFLIYQTLLNVICTGIIIFLDQCTFENYKYITINSNF